METYLEQFVGDVDENEEAAHFFQVTTEFADEPTCDTEEWFDGVPKGYEYLAPILLDRGFERLTFTVELTRVTIKAVT